MRKGNAERKGVIKHERNQEKDNESFDGLFHRFQQLCLKDKLFSEIRKREFFIPPSIREKRNAQRKLKKVGRSDN